MFDIVLGRTLKDMEKYGNKGTVFIGKQYVEMGQTSSLSNPIYLDVSRAHAILVCGKRGGGKCLTAESEILLDSHKTMLIKDIFDKYSLNGVKEKGVDEYYKINENLIVKSFDVDKKRFVDKRVSHVFRRWINEKLVKYIFKTEKGLKSVIATMDHKMLNSENISWINYYNYLDKKNNEMMSFTGYNKVNDSIDKYKIVEIQVFEYQGYVYDLTVCDTHNFVANGIVVHNSYTLGSIAEGLADMDDEVAKNLSFILLDTMGVYWPMKYPNQKDDKLLEQWGLSGKGLDVIIYVPGGYYSKYKEEGIPVDFPFFIKPNELSVEDWLLAFKLSNDDDVAVIVQMVIGTMLDENCDFDIDDIIVRVDRNERFDPKNKLAVINRFETAKRWGIFSKKGTSIRDLMIGGKVVIMDLSAYVAMPGGWEVKSLVLGIIAKKIFIERMLVRKKEEMFDIVNKTRVVAQKDIKDDLPMPWLIVDECHEFLPEDREVPSTKALMTILREGRQPGVSLVMATQQPAKIHTDAITQSDIVISHRITASFDLESLDKIFLSYNSKGAKALFNSMPRTKGCAIIMDDKNERLHTMQVKPRITWHGGEDPNAIREIKDEYDF